MHYYTGLHYERLPATVETSEVSCDMFKLQVTNTATQEAALGTATHHELLCIRTHFEQLGYSVHKALMVKVAHLLNLTVVVSYPGIQLLHEALVGVGLVIVH